MKNRFSCQNVEDRIHQLLDDRRSLSGDSLLAKHADRCADCRALIQEFELFESDCFGDCGAFDRAEQRVKGPKRLTTIKRPAWNLDSISQSMLAVASAVLLMAGLFSISDSGSQANIAALNSSPSVSLADVPLNESVGESIASTIQTESSMVSAALLPEQHKAVQNRELRQEFVSQLIFETPSIIELAQSTPQIIDSVKSSPTQKWNEFSQQFAPINPYLQFSSELPGVRNIRTSLGVTLELLNRSVTKPSKQAPDLGLFSEQAVFAVI